ncbi:MAG: LysR family transcriptional regulator [Rhizobiales bacterium]|nr:LysR family transcriptional regulator [Hyphomicrobiales bacterium]
MRLAYLPTIPELQAFAACADLGTTTKAAEYLNLTQSAISRSINSLEERLGVNLFHRVKQRLQLSDAGKTFQRDAHRLLDDLNKTAMSIMAFGGHSELLKIACLPTFANRWLIPKLHKFQKIAPNLTFDISSRLYPIDFEKDGFDAVIRRGNYQSNDDNSIKIMDEYLIVVASPNLISFENKITDLELIKLPLLQQTTRPTLWLDWFKNTEIDSRAILRGARFDHFEMLISATIAGLGVGLVPEILIEKELKDGRLTSISDRKLIGDEPYTLIYPAKSNDIIGFTKFKQWVETELKQDFA